MTELIITRGLPASGKSTWAKAWVAVDPDNRVRVSRDDIRDMLSYPGLGSHHQELNVTALEDGLVKSALNRGMSVVVDAMHLRARYVHRWAKLHEIEVKDFGASIDVLVSRDKARERSIGESVIRALAKRFQIPADGSLPEVRWDAPFTFIPAPDWDSMKTDAIVVDIDGTLADMGGRRGPYDTSLYHLDTVHERVAEIVYVLSETYPVLITSGRSEDFRDATAKWLLDNHITHDALIMRKSGDDRNDGIVKHDLFHEFIAPKYNVVMVFDDRNRVVEAWRKMGLTVAQVADGDF